MSQELPVISQSMKLVQWLIERIQKMPRCHRYGIGVRIENQSFELLELLVECKFTREKSGLLKDAALCVEQIRLLCRIAHELGLLPNRSHGYAISELHQIGQSIGGWRRHQQQAGK